MTNSQVTEQEVANTIIEIVNNNPGIKVTELISKLASKNKKVLESNQDVPSILDNLVSEGKIRELEYVIPSMSYRIKSIYFPVGTQIFS